MLAAATFQTPMDQANPRNSEQLRSDFERLAREVGPSLFHIACQLCPHDRDTAEDLVQQTLVQGYTQLVAGKLRIEPGTKNWLKKALTNEFLQRIRKDKRLTFANEPQDGVRDEMSDANSNLLTEERNKQIEHALARLTADHRAVIVLVDLQDHDYEAAARILSVPVGTIRSRLARARLKMAEAFRAVSGGKN